MEISMYNEDIHLKTVKEKRIKRARKLNVSPQSLDINRKKI